MGDGEAVFSLESPELEEDGCGGGGGGETDSDEEAVMPEPNAPDEYEEDLNSPLVSATAKSSAAIDTVATARNSTSDVSFRLDRGVVLRSVERRR
ncbi:hypothetical protein F2Q68_00045081 [Brassica cretica]|uniref:Uncharacterized protein n=1 Tax=Brassica cretica TaxID=69181 RepID=A0A8S9LHK9_BRACR|nr:hypothetical protein F2Q68_00045081 [Brassica cretica]